MVILSLMAARMGGGGPSVCSRCLVGAANRRTRGSSSAKRRLNSTCLRLPTTTRRHYHLYGRDGTVRETARGGWRVAGWLAGQGSLHVPREPDRQGPPSTA